MQNHDTCLGHCKSHYSLIVDASLPQVQKHEANVNFCPSTLSWKLQQQEKKVQAMRLHPSSNFPISGLKLIEKQIF